MGKTRKVRIEACVFDAYGTLLDLTSAVEPHLGALGDMAPRLLTLWRAKQLEYTWLRTLMERYADFARVTADALDYTCARRWESLIGHCGRACWQASSG